MNLDVRERSNSATGVENTRDKKLPKKSEVSIEDFEFLKKLGKGAYGEVYLVRKIQTGEKYAMKIVDFAYRELTH